MKETLGPDSLLRPGSLVGSWRVEGYAGRGTYGAVYRARRAGVPDAPLVALKVAVFPDDPRFLRERELLSCTHHPAVPRLLDWGVLEWVRGLSLYEWAHVHPATQRQVLQVLEQVAGALAVLHPTECLHRDVKGANILVEPAGRARLMDFGSGTWKGAPPITESLMPPNTPEYRSPEARGTAGEVAEAARAVAGKLGPKGDVPLWDPEQAATGAERVSAKEVPVSGPGRPALGMLGAAPVRGVLVAAVLVLAGVSTWWVGSRPEPETQEVASVEAPDAGTRGLGDSTRPSRVDSQEPLTAAEARAVAREMLRQPLPGQQRPPCRVAGQREINGGCWRRLADISSPCTEDSYEWNGSCYWPVMERARPKNSKDSE